MSDLHYRPALSRPALCGRETSGEESTTDLARIGCPGCKEVISGMFSFVACMLRHERDDLRGRVVAMEANAKAMRCGHPAGSLRCHLVGEKSVFLCGWCEAEDRLHLTENELRRLRATTCKLETGAGR